MANTNNRELKSFAQFWAMFPDFTILEPNKNGRRALRHKSVPQPIGYIPADTNPKVELVAFLSDERDDNGTQLWVLCNRRQVDTKYTSAFIAAAQAAMKPA